MNNDNNNNKNEAITAPGCLQDWGVRVLLYLWLIKWFYFKVRVRSHWRVEVTILLGAGLRTSDQDFLAGL